MTALIDRLNSLTASHLRCDIGAYIDDRLTDAEKAAFEAALQARVVTWRELAEALLEETARPGEEPPVPDRTFIRKMRGHGEKECRCE